jgi:hypothetical protein
VSGVISLPLTATCKFAMTTFLSAAISARYRSPKRMKCSARALIEPEFSHETTFSAARGARFHAIRRKSYCSRAAAAATGKSLLPTISVCSA